MDESWNQYCGRGWWLAPASLIVGLIIVLVGLMIAVAGGLVQANPGTEADLARALGLQSMALPIVFGGVAFVVASGVLYRRWGDCCDCDWEDEETRPARPNVTVKGKRRR